MPNKQKNNKSGMRKPVPLSKNQQVKEFGKPKAEVNQTGKTKALIARSLKQPERKGTMNTMLSRNLRRMTPAQKAIAMSMLNPGHAGNTANAIGTCAPGSGRVFISKSVFQFEYTLPVGHTAITFFNTPFVEYPVGFYVNNTAYLVPNPNMYTDVTNYKIVENYLKDYNIYAVTPIGVSSTIDPIITVMDQKGSVTTARKPNDCDFVNEAVDNTYQPTSLVNQKMLQEFPSKVNEVSKLTGTIDVRDAMEGAYLISHRQSLEPVVRDHNWNKNPKFTTAPGAGDVAGRAFCRTTEGFSSSFMGYYAADDLRSYCSPSMILPLDMPIAHFNGFKNADEGMVSFRVKVCCSYQFDLKVSSPLYPYSVDRPIADTEFMQYIWAFEGLMACGGFPASYNWLDKLWPVFKQLWKGGGGDLARKIPKAGKWIGDIGDLITDYF